jgi:DNA-binding response OmpR family regulator
MDGLPTLAAKKVLIVEDNFLIAQDLRAVLRGAGYAVCGTAATIAAALQLLLDEKPDGVLLDVGLRDADALPVALALDACGVPFVVITGYDREQLPPALRDRPCLSKPYSPDTLVALAFRTFSPAA